MSNDRKPIVAEVNSLSVDFGRSPRWTWLSDEHRPVKAVDKVSLVLRQGESIGLVGESGSGKTTLAMALLGLGLRTSGTVAFPQSNATRRCDRARFAQMIFQDAHASLSPRLRVSYLLTEPYAIHGIPPTDQQNAEELLRLVGLPPSILERLPHELSGGQARRIVIARALAIKPKLVVADEPTAGLDVSAAAAVLNLLPDLRQRLGLTYLLITHNLAVLSNVTNRIAVMYLGRVVEEGPTARILAAPAHPYTKALIAAVSKPNPRSRHMSPPLVAGDIPSPRNPPSGCHFHPRCPQAQEICTHVAPFPTYSGTRLISCHFPLNEG